MIQTNQLPNILDSHGSYAIELNEVENTRIDVVFIIEYPTTSRTETITYAAYNGQAKIKLDAILKSVFDLQSDTFSYEQTETYPMVILHVIIEDLSLQFFVHHAALPLGNGRTLDNYEVQHKRLGIAPRVPMFKGFPMSTGIIEGETHKRILNTRGCPFDETISSNVQILVTSPTGAEFTATNTYDLNIPDVAESNGIWTVTYTSDDDTFIRQFRVINAGEIVEPEITIDLLFESYSVDVQNEFLFQYQSGSDEVIVTADTTTTDQNTTYQFQITNPNGTVWTSDIISDNHISMNPYLDQTGTIYKPVTKGNHTVKVTVWEHGRTSEHTEIFNILGIEQAEVPMLSLERINFYRVINDVRALVPASIRLSESGTEHLEVEAIGSAEGFTLMLTAPSGQTSGHTFQDGILKFTPERDANNEIILTESGIYNFEVTPMGEGNDFIISRDYSIILTP